ncbi:MULTISPECIES: FAD-dependent oxidoreductase [unclassified Lactobacillus]|uniref:FAD-dependent oxidoreductase n=1 Tax=unclassified Lactobacillus TaxID=2620435 RepID=UPI00226A3E4A|nr:MULTISPECIES: FAD-dependent oxidoreductase [unclassified Lactobacillus]MCX8721495.1 FAD-binding protein [Lactobacillus sp. B4010]MCX8724170.1 FAD-binding protein [Lactobacillus sp. B4005]MCX8733169.1 FAD-binding protein [Lactobacillus sp. B4015]MCX8735290.1 FAD-binding protein [Lactobacillus sp. B4012]
MAKEHKFQWDAVYDVVVVGFGGAGATAARFAADKGAKVLLVDSAPEGHEGGNTRYAGQLVGAGTDYDALKKYHESLAAPLKPDKEPFENLIRGMANMGEYFEKYLGVKAVSRKELIAKKPSTLHVTEYPELPGADSYDHYLVHEGTGDSALWKLLRQKVLDRLDKIDVWYSSPAKHLIQDGFSKVVLGVQIERDQVLRNIKANSGIVLSTGGFENNKEMIQIFLQSPYLSPIGSLYNKGDGIKLLEEVNAQLWNMRSFESLGQFHGLSLRQKEGVRSTYTNRGYAFWSEIYKGSSIVVGDDGTRYFDESQRNRHGHIYNHGDWVVPLNQNHPYMIFDQRKYDELANEPEGDWKVPHYLDHAIKCNTIVDLAKTINKKPEILTNTIEEFNFMAQQGKDYAYHRDPQTLRKFSKKGPYYAIALRQNILNTQGGGRRDGHAQVLDPSNEPIPHLYEAGELGSPFVNKYTGGGNIADCLISGKIAGENAAADKNDLPESFENIFTAGINSNFNPTSDEAECHYETGKNQYLGFSSKGMGDGVVVRTTIDEQGKIKKVEILKQSESDDYGQKAVKELPEKIVEQNSYEVDAVSGASQTSRAIKEAVKDSLDKAKR